MRIDSANVLPRDMQNMLDAEISGDERLLRAAQPAPIRVALRMIPVSIFGLFFGGFATFWIAAAAAGTSHMPHNDGGIPAVFQFFPLFGIPFFLVGVAMVLSPAIAYFAATKTVYAVTDKRAIIVSKPLMLSVKSYYPTDFTDIERGGTMNGVGDVSFCRRLGTDSRGNRTNTAVGFFGVPEPEEFERLIRDLKTGQTTPIAPSSPFDR